MMTFMRHLIERICCLQHPDILQQVLYWFSLSIEPDSERHPRNAADMTHEAEAYKEFLKDMFCVC